MVIQAIALLSDHWLTSNIYTSSCSNGLEEIQKSATVLCVAISPILPARHAHWSHCHEGWWMVSMVHWKYGPILLAWDGFKACLGICWNFSTDFSLEHYRISVVVLFWGGSHCHEGWSSVLICLEFAFVVFDYALKKIFCWLVSKKCSENM